MYTQKELQFMDALRLFKHEDDKFVRCVNMADVWVHCVTLDGTTSEGSRETASINITGVDDNVTIHSFIYDRDEKYTVRSTHNDDAEARHLTELLESIVKRWNK